ncbi:MAG: hypothetical protein ACFFDN_20900 [Candidatus Hodarchaeota archaeon]
MNNNDLVNIIEEILNELLRICLDIQDTYTYIPYVPNYPTYYYKDNFTTANVYLRNVL